MSRPRTDVPRSSPPLRSHAPGPCILPPAPAPFDETIQASRMFLRSVLASALILAACPALARDPVLNPPLDCDFEAECFIPATST